MLGVCKFTRKKKKKFSVLSFVQKHVLKNCADLWVSMNDLQRMGMFFFFLCVYKYDGFFFFIYFWEVNYVYWPYKK